MKKIYKTGIVGARRGLYHAKAYEGIEGMEIQALCEIDPERLEEGVRKLGVCGYKSYEEMLEKEDLDIVHIVTKPSIPRYQWIDAASQSGIKALVIEKPIALMPSELAALDAACHKTDLKIVVNMQRRYMPFAAKYKELMEAGLLGDVHYIRGNCNGSVLDISTHLVDCILFLLSDSKPQAVWACAEGTKNFNNPEERSPDNLIAQYTFGNGERVFFESTEKALGTANFPVEETLEDWQPERCNFDVWTEKGRFWWREYGTWGYQLEGMPAPHVERTHFFRDDISAQAEFTKAIGQWLDDEHCPHSNRYSLARVGMDLIFSAYASALAGRRLSFPTSFDDHDLELLQRKLSEQYAQDSEASR